jgi:hypothetical protein
VVDVFVTVVVALPAPKVPAAVATVNGATAAFRAKLTPRDAVLESDLVFDVDGAVVIFAAATIVVSADDSA